MGVWQIFMKLGLEFETNLQVDENYNLTYYCHFSFYIGWGLC